MAEPDSVAESIWKFIPKLSDVIWVTWYIYVLFNQIHPGIWCIVGFWLISYTFLTHFWHIPTFIITDISPPWWDFVMVGICWVTMTMVMMMTIITIRYVLGLSQGTVSELLSKPKSWDKLTEKGRDSYRKMHAWCHDDQVDILMIIRLRMIYDDMMIRLKSMMIWCKECSFHDQVTRCLKENSGWCVPVRNFLSFDAAFHEWCQSR